MTSDRRRGVWQKAKIRTMFCRHGAFSGVVSDHVLASLHHMVTLPSDHVRPHIAYMVTICPPE